MVYELGLKEMKELKSDQGALENEFNTFKQWWIDTYNLEKERNNKLERENLFRKQEAIANTGRLDDQLNKIEKQEKYMNDFMESTRKRLEFLEERS